MSMQAKILAALTKATTDHDLEVTAQTNWANSGALYISPKGSCEVTLRIGYDFQSEYATVYLMPSKVDETLRSDAPPSVIFSPAGQMCGAVCPRAAKDEDAFWAHIDYAKGHEIQDLVTFTSALPAQVSP